MSTSDFVFPVQRGRADVEQVLVPTLRPADIVVIDLPAHKQVGVHTAFEAASASLIYLSPYSPDLNPIEMTVDKRRALLKQAAARPVEALLEANAEAITAFMTLKCRN